MGFGISPEDFHLNLWILDYSIHLEDVRDSLLEPLEAHIEMLELEAKRLQEKWQLYERTNGIFEDVINDGATVAFSNIEKTPIQSLAIPQEVFETLKNIVLNPDFKLNICELEATSSDLKSWSEVSQKFGSELFKGVSEEIKNDKNNIESFVFLLQNANFIQRNFSLHQVERTIRGCTHKDLAEVQKDLHILTKLVRTFARTIGVILPHIKPLADSDFNTDAFLPSLFQFVEYFVLADISLRHNGYSQQINQMREKVVAKIEEEFSETVRKEFEQSAPIIGQPFSQALELIGKKLTEIIKKI